MDIPPRRERVSGQIEIGVPEHGNRPDLVAEHHWMGRPLSRPCAFTKGRNIQYHIALQMSDSLITGIVISKLRTGDVFHPGILMNGMLLRIASIIDTNNPERSVFLIDILQRLILRRNRMCTVVPITTSPAGYNHAMMPSNSFIVHLDDVTFL